MSLSRSRHFLEVTISHVLLCLGCLAGGRWWAARAPKNLCCLVFRGTQCMCLCIYAHARTSHYVGRVGAPDCRPSLMYVCLQTFPPLPRTHTETRSDGVVSAVCPPALHALLCVGVRHTHTHAEWSRESVCRRGYGQGTGASRSVSSHWPTGGLVYSVAPCPVKGNRPPADCSLHGRQGITNKHTHTIILGGWQTLLPCRRPGAPTLPGSTAAWLTS